MFWSWLSDVPIWGAACEDEGAPMFIICGVKGNMRAPAVPEDIQSCNRIAIIRSLEWYPDGDDVEFYRRSLLTGRCAMRRLCHMLER